MKDREEPNIEARRRCRTFRFGRDGAEEADVVVEIMDGAGIKVWPCDPDETNPGYTFAQQNMCFLVSH